MKKKLLFLIVLLVNARTFAQSGKLNQSESKTFESFEDKTAKSEMGFDMFYFLNIFRQHYEGQLSSVFTVAYNRELSDKISLRTSIGAGYTDKKLIQDSLPTLASKSISTELKAGIAWKKPAFRRWQYYYGVDLEYQYGYTLFQQLTPINSVSVLTDNVTTLVMIGPGPFLGLIFYMNPRVSLSIETNMNFVYSSNTTKAIYADHPEKNTNSTIKGYTSTFITPQNIFLSIKF